MSNHELESTAIKIVAKKLGSLPELVQMALMSCDPVATTMFEQILEAMKGRLK